MKLISVIMISLMLLGCTLAVSETDLPDKYYSERDPASDLKTAVNIASKSGKRIMLKVGGEWCIWCHRLDDFIKSNESLKKVLDENFVVLKINFSPENRNEAFLSNYPAIKGYPHIFVLESDGEFLHSQNTGELEFEKSYNVDKIRNFIETWRPGA